jgi:hypothetical protein
MNSGFQHGTRPVYTSGKSATYSDTIDGWARSLRIAEEFGITNPHKCAPDGLDRSIERERRKHAVYVATLAPYLLDKLPSLRARFEAPGVAKALVWVIQHKRRQIVAERPGEPTATVLGNTEGLFVNGRRVTSKQLAVYNATMEYIRSGEPPNTEEIARKLRMSTQSVRDMRKSLRDKGVLR